LVGIAATGSIITIEDITGSGSWDFFIDNVTFNEPLPPLPDGGPTLMLLGAALGALGIARRFLMS
jgi:hypothetical protein